MRHTADAKLAAICGAPVCPIIAISLDCASKTLILGPCIHQLKLCSPPFPSDNPLHAVRARMRPSSPRGMLPYVLCLCYRYSVPLSRETLRAIFVASWLALTVTPCPMWSRWRKCLRRRVLSRALSNGNIMMPHALSLPQFRR